MGSKSRETIYGASVRAAAEQATQARKAPREHARYEPLYDVNSRTGVSIEVFFADRTLETFGWVGAGWFWWPRRREAAPAGARIGPFATSYAAYRNAMVTARVFS